MKGLHFYVLLASVAASAVFASHPISWGRRLQPGTAAPPAPPSMGCHGGKAVKFIFICERIRLILCFHFYGGILIKFLPPTIAQVLVGVWHIIQSVLASSITARCKYVLSLMIYIIILIAGPIYVGFDVLLTCTRMFMHAWCSQGTFRACQRRWTVRCFE